MQDSKTETEQKLVKLNSELAALVKDLKSSLAKAAAIKTSALALDMANTYGTVLNTETGLVNAYTFALTARDGVDSIVQKLTPQKPEKE